MRIHFTMALSAAALLLSANAFAADTAQQSSMKTCAASWSAKSTADKAKSKYKDYMSSCMKTPAAAAPGKTVAATPAPMMMMKTKPAKAQTAMKMAAPAGGGSAKCKDGKVVTYKSRSGTCSGHGGVATWM